MTAEQRWIRAQRANAKRALKLAEKIERALPAGAVATSRRELTTIERIVAIVDVYADAGGFRREHKAASQ